MPFPGQRAPTMIQEAQSQQRFNNNHSINSSVRQPLAIDEIQYDAMQEINSTGIMGDSLPQPGTRGDRGRFGTRNFLVEDQIQGGVE